MKLRGVLAFLCITLAACEAVPNTGLNGASWASVSSTNDPGVYRDFDTQAVFDGTDQVGEAMFRSTHPGASDGGLGTTDWVYVRTVELDYAAIVSGAYNLSPEIVRFFRECAPALDPTNPEDQFRSGRLGDTPDARLVLTRVTWRTEIGPGPQIYSTARVADANLQVFGASAKLQRPLSLSVLLSVEPGRSFEPASPIINRTVSNIRTGDVTANCTDQTLETAHIAIGESGWFPGGDVYNIVVEIIEE